LDGEVSQLNPMAVKMLGGPLGGAQEKKSRTVVREYREHQ